MSNNLPSNDPILLKAGEYKTDIFNRNPLFLVRKKNLMDKRNFFLVKSWEEAFALHGRASKEDINPKYISALISDMPRTNISPYLKIKRIPRSHNLILTDSNYTCESFDPFNIKIERGDNLDIKNKLLNSICCGLRSAKKFVSIEHSGGLDSNTILGSIILGLNFPTKNIYTWSNYNKEEAISIDKCRSFFNLLPEKCISNFPCSNLNPVKNSYMINKKIIDILGYPSQISNQVQKLEELKKKDCDVLFSGFGGDQGLSHNAANVPTDLLNDLDVVKFKNWMPSINIFIKELLTRSISIKNRNFVEYLVRKKAQKGRYALKRILVKHLTEKGKNLFLPYIIEDYPWESDRFIFQKKSIRKRISSDWISVRSEEETNLAKSYGLKKYFPLLNEEIISILLTRNSEDFGSDFGNGRMIMKNSFSEFLPSHLILEEGKFTNNVSKELISRRTEILSNELKNDFDFENIEHLWNIKEITDECKRILECKNINYINILTLDHTINVLTKIAAWYDFLS